MQTCSRCNALSPDTVQTCSSCQANLLEFSTVSVALKNLIANPRVGEIRINAAADACPFCYESSGSFAKDKVPHLPHEGCSHVHGCRCSYEPILLEIYP